MIAASLRLLWHPTLYYRLGMLYLSRRRAGRSVQLCPAEILSHGTWEKERSCPWLPSQEVVEPGLQARLVRSLNQAIILALATL